MCRSQNQPPPLPPPRPHHIPAIPATGIHTFRLRDIHEVCRRSQDGRAARIRERGRASENGRQPPCKQSWGCGGGRRAHAQSEGLKTAYPMSELRQSCSRYTHTTVLAGWRDSDCSMTANIVHGEDGVWMWMEVGGEPTTARARDGARCQDMGCKMLAHGRQLARQSLGHADDAGGGVLPCGGGR